MIERETPHYFKCKDVKANVMRTVKMTIRGITVLEEGTDNVVGHYNFRQVSDAVTADFVVASRNPCPLTRRFARSPTFTSATSAKTFISRLTALR